jgi:hypothetical protein
MNIAPDRFEDVAQVGERAIIITTNRVYLLRVENGVIIAETMQRPAPMYKIETDPLPCDGITYVDWSSCDICNETQTGHRCEEHIAIMAADKLLKESKLKNS